jgi:hypothetical protein
VIAIVVEHVSHEVAALRDELTRRGYEVGWQLWPSDGPSFMDGTEPVAASKPADGGAP